MLIRAYGLYWSQSKVDWRKRQLSGLLKNSRPVNAWEQIGIYALYDHFRLVYVGQVTTGSLGRRLKQHRKDRFAGRWDSFSWFGVRAFDRQTNELVPQQPREVDDPTIIRSMELIAILLTDAPLNRSQGKFPNSERVRQADTREIEKPSADQLSVGKTLARLKKDLSYLEEAVRSRRRIPG